MSTTKLIFFLVDISALSYYIIYTNKQKENLMDLIKLKKRIAEEQAKLRHFEKQKKFFAMKSEADFKAMMEENFTLINNEWVPKKKTKS